MHFFSGRGTTRVSKLHLTSAIGRVASLAALTAVIASCAVAPQPEAPKWEPPPPPQHSLTPKPSNPGVTPAKSFVAKDDRSIGGCTIFPRDHFLNAREVDTLGVHPRSAEYVRFLGGRDTTLKAPSSNIWQGSRGGMPINVVDSRDVPMRSVTLNKNWTTRGWFGGYPIPRSPRVEGHPGTAWDRHLVMLDVADCTGYELIQYDRELAALTGFHTALSGTKYSLSSTDMPRITTNVANTPLIGQYVTLAEANSGKVDHPVGFCSSTTGKGVTWPARMSDGQWDRPDAPPIGTWIRLRADVDISHLKGQALAIAKGMREHGMVLTDTCGHRFSVMAENSDGWNKTQMQQLAKLTIADFEAVDVTPMMRSESSFRIT